ncbi:MAG TPA: acyl-CoA synthetase [Vicinamibacterales bacterium]|nr:acyl-CoA synthetase [Vicinamibacterales bacterium]
MLRALPPIIEHAAVHRTRTAIVEGETHYTYDDLNQTSALIAARLLAIRRRVCLEENLPSLDEARIAFLVPPGFRHIAIQWGIWRAGGIAVPLPLSHPPAELEFLIRDAEASIAVADSANAAALAPVAESSNAQFLTSDELANSAGPKPRATSSVPQDTPPSVAQSFSPAQRAMILYTSGTTNRPKGVVTTHENLAAQIESLVTAWEWTSSDRTLLVLPLHHVHGIVNVVCCALWSGAVLETHPRFDAEAAWERLASGDLTVFTAVPTMYHRLIQSWKAAAPEEQRRRSQGCRSLRLMMCGSAPLPRTVLDEWQAISGHLLLERYGMTEVGMALANPLKGERRPGFVGQPLPNVSVRLVDGEIQLKGPGVFSEYWRRPEVTRASFADGWFRTGDIAALEGGAYHLLGRSSVDIIKSGGDKISALEIEEVLRAHPAISDCAVVGVDDLEWGQRVCCAVELRPETYLELGELREWARTRLAASKIPKSLMCVKQLPRNAMGKIVKPEVTALFARPAPPAPPES